MKRKELEENILFLWIQLQNLLKLFNCALSDLVFKIKFKFQNVLLTKRFNEVEWGKGK
jgi:hypothetical protein